MHKLFRNLYFVSMLPLAFSSNAEGVDESRLWVPKNYERIYLDLKDAAEAAEKLDRCVKVIRGTIDLEESTREHPIFRIQCRQNNGRTYNEMVDGLTKETLTTVEVDESLVEIKLEEQKALFWSQCKKAFEYKTRLFQGLVLKMESPEPEEFSLDAAKYVVEFDAEDMYGKALEYRAICTVKAEEEAKLTIRKRR